MKTKSLQFGKAMSAALFVLLLSVAGMKNALAQNQVATLQHEGSISMFYGQGALQNAHAAAADGDTITLSSGSFQGCTLSKAVTVHGAGCAEDTVANLQPTTISFIDLYNQNDTRFLTISGVICPSMSLNGKNMIISKCNIDWFSPTQYGNFENVNLENCIINYFAHRGSGTVIVNCIIRSNGTYYSNSEGINTIYNSIIVLGTADLTNTTVINSVISSTGGNDVTNSTFNNCIGIRLGSSSLFNSQVNATNMEVSSYSDIFETFDGTVTFDNIYQLKEEIANSFYGNDGTEVGVYGGMMPYNPRPSYMIIRRCNVAGRTTEDNKLSVEIELNTGE